MSTEPPTRTASRLWHAALAALVGSALVLQVVLLVRAGTDVNPGGAQAGVGTGTALVRLFSYFTIQSNVLVLAAALSLALRPDRDGPAWRVLRLDSLLGIAITGVVYVTVLGPGLQHDGIDWWLNAAVHYASPVATVLGWLLFGPRPRLDRRTLVLAFAWPLAWVAWTFAHGAATGWYPYPFLDAGVIGVPAALAGTGVVLVAGIVLAAVLRVLDPRLPRSPGR
ncbi:Pr6Pr family membrane protein [Kineococcus auxinigenes]|uniref:Pr6Pr family membrane protein n=1 Tax=unclassified Kineococcus TaxID=2621656 RepID=UPI003D7EEEFA